MSKIRFLPARERLNTRTGELEQKSAIVFVPTEIVGSKQTLLLDANLAPSEEFQGRWNSRNAQGQQLVTEDRQYVMFFKDNSIEKEVSEDALADALA